MERVGTQAELRGGQQRGAPDGDPSWAHVNAGCSRLKAAPGAVRFHLLGTEKRPYLSMRGRLAGMEGVSQALPGAAGLKAVEGRGVGIRDAVEQTARG